MHSVIAGGFTPEAFPARVRVFFMYFLERRNTQGQTSATEIFGELLDGATVASILRCCLRMLVHFFIPVNA
jgi:hypothetical protein